MILICTFFLSILFIYWNDRWLTFGLSLKVSIILSVEHCLSNVVSLTFGFFPGFCSPCASDHDNCDGSPFLACGLLLDPFGTRRYVLALAYILFSAKHKCGREPPLCGFEIHLAYYSGMFLVVKFITPCGLSEHFPDQTGLLLKRDSPGRVRMMLHSDLSGNGKRLGAG